MSSIILKKTQNFFKKILHKRKPGAFYATRFYFVAL